MKYRIALVPIGERVCLNSIESSQRRFGQYKLQQKFSAAVVAAIGGEGEQTLLTMGRSPVGASSAIKGHIRQPLKIIELYRKVQTSMYVFFVMTTLRKIAVFAIVKTSSAVVNVTFSLVETWILFVDVLDFSKCIGVR